MMGHYRSVDLFALLDRSQSDRDRWNPVSSDAVSQFYTCHTTDLWMLLSSMDLHQGIRWHSHPTLDEGAMISGDTKLVGDAAVFLEPSAACCHYPIMYLHSCDHNIR